MLLNGAAQIEETEHASLLTIGLPRDFLVSAVL
jgi:hypothetical protein